jgi:hypothetical protein
MARQLRARKFVRQVEVGRDRWCFLFKGRGAFNGSGDADYVAVVWSDDENERGGPLMFKAGEGCRAHEVDLMGNRRDLTAAAGYVTATITSEPKYIVVSDASVPLEVAAPLLEPAAASRPVVVGEETSANAIVRNPLSRSVTVDIKGTLAEPLAQVGAAPSAIELNPGEEKTWALAVRLRADPNSAGLPVRLTAAIRDHPLQAEATVTLLPIRRVRAGERHAGPPLLVLDRGEQVLNHNNILPNTRHLLWGGPRDVSGKAWVYLEGEALVVHVTVLDDRHWQSGAEAELLDGDAVQVAVAIPGRVDVMEVWLGSPDRRQAVTSVRSVTRETNRANIEARIEASVAAIDGGAAYTLKLPWRLMNLQASDLRKGVRVNVAIHDHDGEAKKGLIRAAGGLGDALDPRRFPLVVFE